MKDTIVHTGVLDLILQAGFLVQLILIALLALSVLCWAIVFTKYRYLQAAARENLKFLDLFWKGKNLEDIYDRSEKYLVSPVAQVFKSGYREMRKLPEPDNIQRAMIRTSAAEISQMERHVPWLATTASSAPFIGLFGTVWGIMSSFQSIGAQGSANLAVVAPGIAEALIATAAGLAAAIPSAMFYNMLVNHIKRIAVDMDNFSNDFLNIVKRGSAEGSKK
ncbi:MAG: protein TolQ [Microbacteriaceae bacterium]|nr:protein TolQ [Microbacteriaceae bacterium]